jgi:hypothetical protein
MKYILITLGVVLLIIFGIVIFNSGGSKTVVSPGKKVIKLTDYTTNNNASVQYTVEGPINALENHRTLQINVSPTSRTINIFTGYQGESLVSQTYTNGTNSYQAFLAALNRASFTREHRLSQSVNPDSICPVGNRTHYVVIDNNKDVMNLWSASCATGTFGGNISLTGTLFKSQIPNYATVTNGVSVGSTSSSFLY